VNAPSTVISVDRLLADLEDEALRDLDVTSALLWSVAHPSHTPQTLTLSWEDFRDRVLERAALAGDARHWSEFYDPAVCSGQAQAIDLKSGEIDTALAVILNGPGAFAL
jgi:hypothetical protein